MKPDAAFWAECGREWGRGKGYRDRINNHNAEWFQARHHGEADTRVFNAVVDGWTAALASVRELLTQE